jgi:hypothetical protein
MIFMAIAESGTHPKNEVKAAVELLKAKIEAI